MQLIKRTLLPSLQTLSRHKRSDVRAFVSVSKQFLQCSQSCNQVNSTIPKACKPETSRPKTGKPSVRKATPSSKKPSMTKKKDINDASKQAKGHHVKSTDKKSRKAQCESQKTGKKEEKERSNLSKPKRFPRGSKKTDSSTL